MDTQSVDKFKVIPIKGKAHGGMQSISAESISIYMWGKDFACYTILKNDVEVPFKTSDIAEFRKYLLSFNKI